MKEIKPYHPFIEPPSNIFVRLDRVENLKITWQTFPCAKAPVVHQIKYIILNKGKEIGRTTDNQYFYSKNYVLDNFNFTIEAKVQLTSDSATIEKTGSSKPVTCKCLCKNYNDQINISLTDGEFCNQELKWQNQFPATCKDIQRELRFTNEFTNENYFDTYIDPIKGENKNFKLHKDSVQFSLEHIKGYLYDFLKVSKREVFQMSNYYIESQWTDWKIVGDMCCPRKNDYPIKLSIDKSQKCDAIFTWNENPNEINLRSDKCKIDYELWEQMSNTFEYHYIPRTEMYEKRIFGADDKSHSYFQMRMKFTDEFHNVRFSAFSNNVKGINTCCRRDKMVEKVNFKFKSENIVQITWEFPESKCVRGYLVVVQAEGRKATEVTNREFEYKIENLDTLFHVAFTIQVLFTPESDIERSLQRYYCNPRAKVNKVIFSSTEEGSELTWQKSDEMCFTHYEIKIINKYNPSSFTFEYVDKTVTRFKSKNTQVFFQVRKIVKNFEENNRIVIRGNWSDVSKSLNLLYLGEVNDLKTSFREKTINVEFNPPTPIAQTEKEPNPDLILIYYALAFRPMGKLSWHLRVICDKKVICKAISKTAIEKHLGIKIKDEDFEERILKITSVSQSYTGILKCNSYELKIISANRKGFGKTVYKKVHANPDVPKNPIFEFYPTKYVLKWEESPENCVNFYEVQSKIEDKFVSTDDKVNNPEYVSPHNSRTSELKVRVRAVAVTDIVFKSDWTSWIQCSCNCGKENPPRLSMNFPDNVDYQLTWDLDNAPCIYRYELNIKDTKNEKHSTVSLNRARSSYSGSFTDTPSLENYVFKIRKQYFDNNKKLKNGEWSDVVQLSSGEKSSLDKKKPKHLSITDVQDGYFNVYWSRPDKSIKISKYIIIIKCYTSPCKNYLKIMDSKSTKLSRKKLQDRFDNIREHANFKTCTLFSERDEFEGHEKNFSVKIKKQFSPLIYKICVRALKEGAYLTDQICVWKFDYERFSNSEMIIKNGETVELEWSHVDKLMYNFISIDTQPLAGKTNSKSIKEIHEGNKTSFPIDEEFDLRIPLLLTFHFSEDNTQAETITKSINISCKAICSSKPMKFKIVTTKEKHFIIWDNKMDKENDPINVKHIDIHYVTDFMRNGGKTYCTNDAMKMNLNCFLVRNKTYIKVRIRPRTGKSTGKWSSWHYLYKDTGIKITYMNVTFEQEGYVSLSWIPSLAGSDFYQVKTNVDEKETEFVSRWTAANIPLLIDQFKIFKIQVKPNGLDYPWSEWRVCDLSQVPKYEMYYEQLSIIHLQIDMLNPSECINSIVIDLKDSSGVRRHFEFFENVLDIDPMLVVKTKMTDVKDLFNTKFRLAYGVGSKKNIFYIGEFTDFEGCTSKLKPELNYIFEAEIGGKIKKYYHLIQIKDEKNYRCFNEIDIKIKNMDEPHKSIEKTEKIKQEIRIPITDNSTLNYKLSGRFLQKIDEKLQQKSSWSPLIDLNCLQKFKESYLKEDFEHDLNTFSWRYMDGIFDLCKFIVNVTISCNEEKFKFSNKTYKFPRQLNCSKLDVVFSIGDPNKHENIKTFKIEKQIRSPTTKNINMTTSITEVSTTFSAKLHEKSTWEKIPAYLKIIGAVGLAIIFVILALLIRKLIMKRNNIKNYIKSLFSKSEKKTKQKSGPVSQVDAVPEKVFSLYDVDSWND